MFIWFMISTGGPAFAKIGTFGSVAQTTYSHPILGVEISEFKDDSLLILLNFVISIVLIGIFIFLWSVQIRENNHLENMNKIGR
ncbi:MAG: hypothetical protein K2H02_05855, partial [Anaeroplasmataceae bacterium]|nr:hypothetical protein [Anaeroplasmataceae bacterium]